MAPPFNAVSVAADSPPALSVCSSALTICADAPLTASRIFSRRVTLGASCDTLVNAP